jgi:hypothetical protein
MNLETKIPKAAAGVQKDRKVRTLGLRLTVGNRDLASEIKRAFDLAKSSGQELDLTFKAGTF